MNLDGILDPPRGGWVCQLFCKVDQNEISRGNTIPASKSNPIQSNRNVHVCDEKHNINMGGSFCYEIDFTCDPIQ